MEKVAFGGEILYPFHTKLNTGESSKKELLMANTIIDAKGLKCPQPTLRLTATVATLKAGDTIEVVADCSTFEADVKGWCQRMKKILISMKDEGAGVKRATIKT